jgi:hypothetical protein
VQISISRETSKKLFFAKSLCRKYPSNTKDGKVDENAIAPSQMSSRNRKFIQD